MWCGAAGRGTPGLRMGSSPPPIGMAVLSLAEPRQMRGGGGGREGGQPGVPAASPGGGCPGIRGSVPRLSPGAPATGSRKCLWRRNGQQAGILARRRATPSGQFRTLLFGTKVSLQLLPPELPIPGAIATPHHALRGRLSGAHPNSGARGPMAVCVVLQRGRALWGEVLLTRWRLKGRREPPGRGREAKRLLSSGDPGGEAGGARHGGAAAQSAVRGLALLHPGGPERTHVTTAWKRSVADLGKREK